MHLHNQDVIHGDLALRNILYDEIKQRCAVADFGLAHHKDVRERTNVIPVRWTAPEVFRMKR